MTQWVLAAQEVAMQPSLLCDLLAQQARLKTKRKREKKK
jgi:hypothetical protein